MLLSLILEFTTSFWKILEHLDKVNLDDIRSLVEEFQDESIWPRSFVVS